MHYKVYKKYAGFSCILALRTLVLQLRDRKYVSAKGVLFINKTVAHCWRGLTFCASGVAQYLQANKLHTNKKEIKTTAKK